MYIRSPYPPLPPVPPTNYHNLLFRTPDQLKLSDYVMYIDGVTGQQRTRYEFVERMYDVVTALGADKAKGGLGLGSECMVGILSDNCLDYCTLVHALLALTTPFALFSSYATSKELKHYLERSKATHIFVHASLLPRLLPAAKEEGLPLENIFILDGQVPPNAGAIKTLESMIQNIRTSKIPREPVRPAGKDTLAYLVFSSGTSGLPKAVMVSHGNLIASLLQGVVQGMEYVKANPDVDLNIVPVTLGFLPLFHSFGLHYLCLKIPLRPATVVLLPRWNLEIALKVIPKYRITHLALIPSVIHTLVSSPKFAKTDFSSIVAIGSGAAYLPPALAEKMKTKMKQASMSEGYGASEATLSLIGQPLPNILKDTIEHVPNATGILVPGVDAVVLHPDGSHCLPNEAGELYVKGDNVALGYWNDPDSTKESFIGGGWLKTGDRFRVTPKGTFYFEDRAKDTLKVSGMQVAPAELEDTVLSTPGQIISDVAVGGVNLPTARTSDDKAPRAWVVLTAKGKELGKEKASKEVEEWIRQSLSKYKWLRGGVEVVDQLPKSPTGKVLRRVLVDKYQASSTRSKL